MLPRLYLRSSTGLGKAPVTSGGPGGRVLPSTRFCLLSLCPCLALRISAESHRQTHFSPATKMQETGDSQWRTVLQSPHRGTALCFPLKQIRGRRSPLPTLGGRVFPSQEAQGVSAGRGGLAQPGLGAWTPSSFLFRAWGRWGRPGAPWLACEGVRLEMCPLHSLSPASCAPRCDC